MYKKILPVLVLLLFICLIPVESSSWDESGSESSSEASDLDSSGPCSNNGSLKNSTATIRVGGGKNFPPYEFLDQDGRPSGYHVDLTTAIARVMNLDVEIILNSWPETYQGLLSGDIDLIQGLFFSDDRVGTISFSQPHTVIHHSVFQKKDSTNLLHSGSLPEGICIVVENSIMHEYAEDQGYRFLITTPLLDEALKLLNKGTGDYVLAPTVPALSIIHENGYRNVENSGIPLHSQDCYYGSLCENEELVRIFSEGLNRLKESGEYSEIRSRWLDGYDSPILRSDVVRIILWILFPLSLLFLIWFAWSFSLKKSVVKKTKELRVLTQNLNDKISELETAKEQIHTTLHSIGDAVISIDSTGIISQINQAAIHIMKIESEGVVGSRFSDLFQIKEIHREKRDVLDIDLMECTSLRSIPRGLLLCFKNHLEVDISCTQSPIQLPSGELIGSILVFRDMTNEIQVQRRFHEMSRMEELGRLAGGIAHDFNNQLTGILGYADLILLKNPDSQIENYAKVIVKNAKKSSVMVNKLQSFAQQGKVLHDSIDIHSMIDELITSSNLLELNNIEFCKDFMAENCLVMGDSHQIYNALGSILQNAVDAINMKKTSGQVILETRNIEGPDTQSKLIRISISDDGIGMKKEVQEKILEPFFTTKPEIYGFGMGLPAAHGIIKNHQGDILFQSEHGKGTTVTVTLPVNVL
jgi:two-component system sensor histidine kinase EvgS